MEAVFVPEPTEEERRALLAALADGAGRADESAWREAALREGTETDDAVTTGGRAAFNPHDVLSLW